MIVLKQTRRLPTASKAHFAKRALAGTLAVALLCSPLGGLVPAVNAQSPVRDPNSPTVNGPALPPPLPAETPMTGQPSILLFPFANDTSQPALDDVAMRVGDALRFRLNSVGAYKVTTYTKFLAPIERAVQDGVIAETDIGGPFTDPQKAGKLAGQVQTTDYLLGSLESFRADPNTRKVTIEVSADLRDTRTGNSVRTLAFTGNAAPYSNSDTLDAVTVRAIDSVASKLAAAINGNRAPMTMPMSQRGHNSGKQAFLLAVLGGALLYAVLHNSNNTNGGSGSGIINSSPGSTGSTGTGTGTTGSSGPPSPPTGF